MQKKLGVSRSAKNFKEMHLHVRMEITECQRNLELGDHRGLLHRADAAANKPIVGLWVRVETDAKSRRT